MKHSVTGAATAARRAHGILPAQLELECDKNASSDDRMDRPSTTLVDCIEPWPLGHHVRKKP
jgi:hypothetical protein